MNVLEHHEYSGHEHVSFFSDEATGLKAIVALHRTRGTIAGGGIRFFPYRTSHEALTDVLRLSRAMTYKSVLAGLDFGGGKSVIIGNPKVDKSDALLARFGQFVHALGGKYVCAEDIGITPDDMVVIGRSTPYVTGLPGKSGDTSPMTGYGVYRALCAAAAQLQRPLESVALLGYGNVGRHLAGCLARRGGIKLYVADVNQENVRRAVDEYQAVPVSIEALFGLPVDAIAPCSIGAVLNDTTIPLIQAPIVCGGANNQLAEDIRHSQMLAERGVLFVPDYIANAGGLISGSAEVVGRSEEQTQAMVAGIYDTCTHIFNLAAATHCTPVEAAERLAKARLDEETLRNPA